MKARSVQVHFTVFYQYQPIFVSYIEIDTLVMIELKMLIMCTHIFMFDGCNKTRKSGKDEIEEEETNIKGREL